MEGILNAGIGVVNAIQGLGAWLETPMKLLSFLGTEDFFMLALPILFWCVETVLGMKVAMMLLIGSSLNGLFKLALQGPRPYWYSAEVAALAGETSFGAPSGHAQTAAGIWGMLALGLGKRWAWIAAILLAFLIGLSRLYLGVHFPHDVLLGWLLGALLLWLVARLWNPVAAWLRKRSAWQQILAGLGLALLLFVPAALTSLWLRANWSLPSSWVDQARSAFSEGPLPDPLSLEGLVSHAGTLFGLVLGLVWLIRLGWFATKGPWWQLLLRVLVGLVGVLAIRYGLKAIFPEGESLSAFIFRFLRYGCIGFWVAGGAPWAFLRLKLAEKAAS